ncbi:MFS transporter [Acidisoma cellulosilytica]|uniref:MFS transporter n=1 Tax=Acidisoma cellulosilyticum TaxID=2802395 RepID=A0A963Z686_9PROT|nr:MFS transporter [Acidisoma cellulosilyticum]MCB8882578.1 MFS transporter [Acidisoma cellulosilyticum]
MSFAAGEAAARRPSLSATLAICTASQALATSSILALAAITPIVARSLSIYSYWIGYQVSLIYFAGIFASAVSGSLIKRWGAARVGQIGLLCAAFGLLGLATGKVPAMIVSSLLLGVGYACNNPSSSHMLQRLAPSRLRNVIFSIKQAGVPLGGVLAALSMPPLSEAVGWQWALIIAAIPCLVLGMTFGLLREWWDDDRKPQTLVGVGAVWEGQKRVWARSDLRLVSMLGMLYAAVQLSVSAFTVTMLVSELGWTTVQAGAVAAAVQVCGAIGRVVWGVVADLLGAGFLVLALLGLMIGLCCIALLWSHGLTVRADIAILCVLGASAIGWNGVMLAETARLSALSAAAGSGTLTGDVMVYTFIGVVIGPSAFAFAYGHIGSYTISFALFSIPALVGGVIALWGHLRSQSLVRRRS